MKFNLLLSKTVGLLDLKSSLLFKLLLPIDQDGLCIRFHASLLQLPMALLKLPFIDTAFQ